MRLKDAQMNRVGGCEMEKWSFAGKPKEVIGFCKSHLCLVKTCEYCGEEFHTKRHHTKTCSDRCRRALSRKNKIWADAHPPIKITTTKKGLRVIQTVLIPSAR